MIRIATFLSLFTFQVLGLNGCPPELLAKVSKTIVIEISEAEQREWRDRLKKREGQARFQPEHPELVRFNSEPANKQPEKVQYKIIPRTLTPREKARVTVAYREFARKQDQSMSFSFSSPKEQQEIVKETILRGSAYLERWGVEHKIISDGKTSFIRIVPKENGPFLNQKAFELKIKINGELRFDPKTLFRHGAAGGFDRENRKLFLGLNDLPHAEISPMETLSHELDHVDTLIDLLNGKDSPYYGFFQARRGSQLPGQQDGYHGFYSVDEIRTFRGSLESSFKSLRKDFADFKKHVETKGMDKKAHEIWDKLDQSNELFWNNVLRCRLISERGELLANQLSQEGANYRLSFRTDDGRVEAKVDWRDEVNNYKASIPLVKSPGARSSTNRELFRSQISSLQETAAKAKANAELLTKMEDSDLIYNLNTESNEERQTTFTKFEENLNKLEQALAE